MLRFVSKDEDSVHIQIVIIAIDDKFCQGVDESLTKTDRINLADSEKKRIGQSFGQSGIQVLSACDDWDFLDDEEDVW